MKQKTKVIEMRITVPDETPDPLLRKFGEECQSQLPEMMERDDGIKVLDLTYVILTPLQATNHERNIELLADAILGKRLKLKLTQAQRKRLIEVMHETFDKVHDALALRIDQLWEEKKAHIKSLPGLTIHQGGKK